MAPILILCTAFAYARDGDLCAAVRENDLARLAEITSEGDVAELMCGEDPILKLAVLHSSAKLAERLIASNVPVNSRDQLGRTPLHYAAMRGAPDLVQLLLAHGARPSRDGEGATPLHLAVASAGDVADRKDVIAQLLRVDASLLESTDLIGRTPLLMAAELGDFDAVHLLVSFGARVDVRSDRGATALHHAASADPISTLRNSEKISFFLEAGGSTTDVDLDGATPLHAAALSGQLESFRHMLAMTDDVLLRDKRQWTLLHAIAAGESWSADRLAMAQLLVARQHDIDHAEDTDSTALHYAAARGHAPLVSYLLDANANVNRKNAIGYTALHYAARRNDVETGKLLLAHGADRTVRDASGRTPLQRAHTQGAAEFAGLLQQ